MDRRIFIFILIALIIVGLLALSLIAVVGMRAVNTPGEETPTATINVTQAYQTVEARLTLAASVTPDTTRTLIPTESGQSTATATLLPSATATPPQPTATSAIPCDRAAAGNPIDVTIPDDTEMSPGEEFTKIWSLVNVGTCSWDSSYAAVWFSGEMMGAPDRVPLSETVEPNESVEISVDMVAPNSPGTYQSNWKLENNAGVLFGIGPTGDSPFWVRIIVVEEPTEIPQASPTPTEGTPEPTLGPTPIDTLTPSPTPTEMIQVSGPASLTPDDLLDLDSLAVNPGGGADLLYHANEQNMHWLSPQSTALLGVFGATQPSRSDCENANLSTASLPVESLATGTFLCHRTDEGRLGWTRLANLNPDDFTLSVEVLTWAGP